VRIAFALGLIVIVGAVIKVSLSSPKPSAPVVEPEPSAAPEPEPEPSPEATLQDAPDQPAQDALDQPAQDAPDQAPQDAPDQPAQDAPDQPAQDAPDQPAQDAPDQAPQDAPDQLAQDAPDQPAQGAPGVSAEVLALAEQARVLEKKGKRKQAAELYEKALAIDPNAAPVLSRVAFDYLNRGKLEEAKSHAARAVAVDPTSSEGWIVLGAALQALGSGKEAFEAYRNCAARGVGDYVSECRRMLKNRGP
jgi:tetratricopeptide (TPR) repeat protein